MGEGRLGEDLKGSVIVDKVIYQTAAMAVVSIFAQANIGNNQQFRHLVLQLFDRRLNNSIFGMGA